MYDLLIPVDAKVRHGTMLASTLRAHHRFAVFFRENNPPPPHTPNPTSLLLQRKVAANGFELSGVLIRYSSSGGGGGGGPRRRVHACTDEKQCERAVTCVIVLVAPDNCGFVFLSSHFTRAPSSSCQVLFLGVGNQQTEDRQ